MQAIESHEGVVLSWARGQPSQFFHCYSRRPKEKAKAENAHEAELDKERVRRMALEEGSPRARRQARAVTSRVISEAALPTHSSGLAVF